MQDPIADMLTRVRNGQSATKHQVMMPASKAKTAIAKVLLSEGYINGFEVVGTKLKPELTISLKYHNNKPVIELVQRVSRPSLRQYKGKDELPKVMDGLGVAIISTSKGIMSARDAQAAGEGGEVLCIVA
jgi:small subunit ribosomal protein S8